MSAALDPGFDVAALMARLGVVPPRITADSRDVRPGDAFAAYPGAVADGRAFIGDALGRGAGAVFWEPGGFRWNDGVAGCRQRRFRSCANACRRSRHSSSGIRRRRCGRSASPAPTARPPARTGSRSASSAAGVRAGVLGTLGNGRVGALAPARHTTADAAGLQEVLAELRRTGAEAVAMEVSSHGLDQGRVNAVAFDVALFTNLTRDHLDYHGTMEAYGAAKARLFRWPGLVSSVLNADDAFGARLAAEARRQGRACMTYGQAAADIRASAVVADAQGIRCTVDTPAGRGELAAPVVGSFNLANVLGCLGVLLASGVALPDALAALREIEPPAGRMQRLGGGEAPLVVVDYAHTPDALEKVLLALRPAVAPGGALACVFGCGGDRDAGKRPAMGRIAARLADRVVVTSDNPRSEDPAAIAEAIVAGIEAAGAVDWERRARSRGRDRRRGGGRATRRRGADRRQGARDDAGGARHARALLRRRGRHRRPGGLEVAMMNLLTAAQAVGGRVQGADVTFTRVVTDSRALQPGDLFVALAGERFDGHDFVAEALSRGAVAAMVAETRAAGLAGNLVVVADTLAALGALAAWWRRRFALPLIAVVGSNGKTTVKEMIATILRAHFGDAAVLATQGNLNNAIGLPLTLLRLSIAHRAAVVEIGMNHPGETARLAAIARPTVAVVNNAQREHQEFMGSIGEVAHEHAALVRALGAGGVAVLNADDAYVDVWRDAARDAGATAIEFALEHPAAVRDRSLQTAQGGLLELSTPAGDATVAARRAGPAQRGQRARRGDRNAGDRRARWSMSCAASRAFRPVPGRLAEHVAASGATVIDDTYNANPDSVRAAIAVLAARPAPRWLVLGDMGEVGSEGPAFHREAGSEARAAGIDALFTTGLLAAEATAAFGAGAAHFASADDLARHVAGQAAAGTTVLVKGSRFMRMERVVAALAAPAHEEAH